MEKIESKNTSRATYIEDAYVVTPRNRIVKRYAAWLAVLAVAVVLAGAWATNHFYIEPRGDDALVSKALQQLGSAENSGDKVTALTRSNAPDRVAKTYQMLMPSASDSGHRDRVDGYMAALRIAMRAGIPEAKLRYGMALRDGLTGKRDSAAALKIFDEVDREMEPGVKAGDPVAMYVTAWMHKEGLGKQPDTKKAIELAKRAVERLDGWRLESAAYDLASCSGSGWFDDLKCEPTNGIFKGYRDLNLVSKLAQRMIDQKLENGPDVGLYSCADSDTLKSVSCEKDWYGRGVNAGFERYIQLYAYAMLSSGEPLKVVDEMFARGDKNSEPHGRYIHSVVRSMLASDDKQLMRALRDMWQQVTLHTGLPNDYSLKVGSFGLDMFHKAVLESGFVFTPLGKPSPLSGRDQFLIAANVRGILMGREQWMQEQLQALFSDKLDIAKRAQSPEILRKSQIAAKAIIEGLPSDKVSLGNVAPNDAVTNSNPFDVFDIDRSPSTSTRKFKNIVPT